MKNPGAAMGLIGFAIGGAAVCYWEMRPAPQSASAKPPTASAAPAPPTRPPAFVPPALRGKKANAGPVIAASGGPAQAGGGPAQTAGDSPPTGGPPPERTRRVAGSDSARNGDEVGSPMPGSKSDSAKRDARLSQSSGAAPHDSAPAPDSNGAAGLRSARSVDSGQRYEDSQHTSSPRTSDSRDYSTAGDVHIHRVLVGGQVLDAGVVSQAVLKEHDRGDRYLVYFQMDIDAPGVRYDDFRLEDGKGLIYEPIRTHDALGNRGAESESRGGVAFAVYNDAAPARLLRRSGPDSFAALPQSVFQPGR